MIQYLTEINQNIDWDEAVIVFKRAPLGKRKRTPEKLKRAFESSYAVVIVFDNDKLIGMGRALCDGEYQREEVLEKRLSKGYVNNYPSRI